MSGLVTWHADGVGDFQIKWEQKESLFSNSSCCNLKGCRSFFLTLITHHTIVNGTTIFYVLNTNYYSGVKILPVLQGSSCWKKNNCPWAIYIFIYIIAIRRCGNFSHFCESVALIFLLCLAKRKQRCNNRIMHFVYRICDDWAGGHCCEFMRECDNSVMTWRDHLRFQI